MGQPTDELLNHFEQNANEFRAGTRRRMPNSMRPRIGPSDVIQEARFRVWKGRETVRDWAAERVRAWFFRILRNCRLNCLRAHTTAKRDVAKDAPLNIHSQGAEIKDAAASQQNGGGDEQATRSKRLLAAIGALKKDDQELIKWRYQERLDWRSIGQKLGISKDAARVRHARILASLRARLKSTPE